MYQSCNKELNFISEMNNNTSQTFVLQNKSQNATLGQLSFEQQSHKAINKPEQTLTCTLDYNSYFQVSVILLLVWISTIYFWI